MAQMLSSGLAPEGAGSSEAGKVIMRGYLEQMRAVIEMRRQQGKTKD